MRIVVLSEGNTDIRVGLHDVVRGVIGVFVQRLLADAKKVDRSEIHIKGDRLPRLNRGGSFDRKVELAIGQNEGKCDGMVIVVDRDGERNRGRIQLLESGRSRCRQVLAGKTALGVAVEEMEAWLLADTTALADVLGVDGATPDPETLSDPKSHLAMLAQGSALSVPEYYDQLAGKANIDAIAKRCRAFDRFAREIRERIAGN